MIHSDKFRVANGFHESVSLECTLCCWEWRNIDLFDSGIGLGHLISRAEAHWHQEHAEEEK